MSGISINVLSHCGTVLGLLADALPVALFILVASAILLPIKSVQSYGWDFLMFYQFFLSLQVKQSMVISNKYHIYESPQEVPHDFRPRISGNLKILGKSQNFIEWQPSGKPFSQNRNFVNTSKQFPKSKSWTFLAVHYQ